MKRAWSPSTSSKRAAAWRIARTVGRAGARAARSRGRPAAQRRGRRPRAPSRRTVKAASRSSGASRPRPPSPRRRPGGGGPARRRQRCGRRGWVGQRGTQALPGLSGGAGRGAQADRRPVADRGVGVTQQLGLLLEGVLAPDEGRGAGDPRLRVGLLVPSQRIRGAVAEAGPHVGLGQEADVVGPADPAGQLLPHPRQGLLVLVRVHEVLDLVRVLADRVELLPRPGRPRVGELRARRAAPPSPGARSPGGCRRCPSRRWAGCRRGGACTSGCRGTRGPGRSGPGRRPRRSGPGRRRRTAAARPPRLRGRASPA